MHRLFFALALLVAFTGTARQSTAQTRFEAAFDEAVPPALPAGWEGVWETSTSSASTGSGANNVAHAGTNPGVLTGPAFDLPDDGAELTYLARRTSSYPENGLTISLLLADGTPVPVPGATLPTEASVWQMVSLAVPAGALAQSGLRLRFEGDGGSSSGSNLRIDDVRIEAAAPVPGTDRFGFAFETTEVLSETASVLVPVDLSWTGAEGLHGVQFRVAWDAADVAWTGLQRGTGILDLGVWQLTAQATAGQVDVLLVSGTADGLPAADYDPLLYLVFDAPAVADTLVTTFRMSDLTASLAVPEGTDAGLAADPDSTLLRVLPRIGVFALPDTLDLGAAPVGGSTSGSVWIRNTGSATLTVTEVTSDHAAMSVSGVPVSIATDDSAAVSVAFAPTGAETGAQAGTLSWQHDGVGPTTLIVQATGEAAWGDGTDDGLVDVVDIVMAIDVALGRQAPEPLRAARLDLYPFPDGDGRTDVRDVTVLTQAVLRGVWPNAAALPSVGVAAGKVGDDRVRLEYTTTGISVQTGVALRGLQASWTGRTQPVAVPAPDGVDGVLVYAAGTRRTLVWAPVSGNVLPTGRYRLAWWPRDDPVPGYAVAAGEAGDRIEVASTEGPLPESAASVPWPNPFDPHAHGMLHIPVDALGDVRLYDATGRLVWSGPGSSPEVRWDGLTRAGTRAAAGLYLVHVGARRHTVVVQ